MNPYLLFILLDLPYMPGPVIPEDFPSGYYMPGEDSLATLRHYSWQGPDTMELRVGDSRRLATRVAFTAGCPVSQTDFTNPPDTRPDRVLNYACSGGKVVGWFSPTRQDSGIYYYRNGLLDSVLRFEKVASQKPFTKSFTAKIEYDDAGRPVRMQEYWFEGIAAPEDSLTTTYAYHLPDSVVTRSFHVAVAEMRTSTIRLSGGRPVSMMEVVEQDGEVWKFGHVWTWGGASAIMPRGHGLRRGRLTGHRPFRIGTEDVRLDGRRMAYPPKRERP